MAVTTQNSTQYEALYGTSLSTLYPTEINGEVKIAYFAHDQSGAGDSSSIVYAVKLPPGRVRLIGKLCNVYVNWTTASATMDVGWLAYTGLDGTTVAADADGLDDGLDVDAAGNRNLCSVAACAATGYTKLFESRDGVTITFTTASTAIASGDDLVGTLAYVVCE